MPEFLERNSSGCLNRGFERTLNRTPARTLERTYERNLERKGERHLSYQGGRQLTRPLELNLQSRFGRTLEKTYERNLESKSYMKFTVPIAENNLERVNQKCFENIEKHELIQDGHHELDEVDMTHEFFDEVKVEKNWNHSHADAVRENENYWFDYNIDPDDDFAKENFDKELPRGWEHLQTDKGKDYWSDHTSKTTHWYSPMVKGTRILAHDGPHKGVTGDLVADCKLRPPQKAHWQVETRSGKVVMISVRDMQIVHANIKNTKAKETAPEYVKNRWVLPPGWRQAIDDKTGRVYYVNDFTRKSQWKPPTKVRSIEWHAMNGTAADRKLHRHSKQKEAKRLRVEEREGAMRDKKEAQKEREREKTRKKAQNEREKKARKNQVQDSSKQRREQAIDRQREQKEEVARRQRDKESAQDSVIQRRRNDKANLETQKRGRQQNLTQEKRARQDRIRQEALEKEDEMKRREQEQRARKDEVKSRLAAERAAAEEAERERREREKNSREGAQREKQRRAEEQRQRKVEIKRRQEQERREAEDRRNKQLQKQRSAEEAMKKQAGQGDMRMRALAALQHRPLGIKENRETFNREVSQITSENFTVGGCGVVTVSQLIHKFAEFDEYDIFAERVILKREWRRIMGYGFDRKKVLNAMDVFSNPDELINSLQEEKAMEQQQQANVLAANETKNIQMTHIRQPQQQQQWGMQVQQQRQPVARQQQWGVLPSGWEAKRDPRNRKVYYINHSTRQTTFDQPLPPGWEAKLHNGKPYFIQHSTKATSWADPRKPIYVP